MPCGDAGRERHAHSYLLIATNKQPFVPWGDMGRAESPQHQAGAINMNLHPPCKAIQTRTDRQSLPHGSYRANSPALRDNRTSSDPPTTRTQLP